MIRQYCLQGKILGFDNPTPNFRFAKAKAPAVLGTDIIIASRESTSVSFELKLAIDKCLS